MDKQEVIERTRPLFQKAGFVRSAALFGSYSRSEQTQESDVDFLVTLEDGVGLLRLEALRMQLEEALGKHVDLLSERGLKPRLRQHVLPHKVAVYEKR